MTSSSQCYNNPVLVPPRKPPDPVKDLYDGQIYDLKIRVDSFWRWNLMTSSSQCHNNPVLVPPRKPPDPVKDLYDDQIYDLKKRVDIWMRMDMVPVEYGTFAQI